MENINSDQKTLLKILTDEFVEKLQFTQSSNIGIFQALQHLGEHGDLWELLLILFIGEHEPVTIDQIVNHLAESISKSTVYRRINTLIQSNILIKQQDALIRLCDNLQSLSTLAKLHTSLQKVKITKK